jgi:LysR family nitrogen assimilation transcriptional regulator
MNFHRLRYFRAAAEFGSLRKAAKALDISQPSLTRQIQILEHEIKTPLFVRDSKRLMITPAGALLASRIGFILDEIGSVQRDIAKLSDDRRTHMRIGAIQSTCDVLVPHAIRALRVRYPTVQVAVHGIRSGEIIEQVGRRALDIGIVAAPVSDPRLVQTALARDTFCMVASRRHRYGAMTRLSLSQLEGEPFITFPRGFALRDLVERAFHDLGLEMNVVVELESIEAIKELVREGGGISMLPASTLLGDKNRRDLMNAAIEGAPLTRDIVAIRHAGDQLSRPLAFLQEALRSALQAPGALPISVPEENRLIPAGLPIAG